MRADWCASCAAAGAAGHTMCTVVMWGVAAHVLGWDAALRVLPYATLLMAFSRVVTGAHFFHDVSLPVSV